MGCSEHLTDIYWFSFLSATYSDLCACRSGDYQFEQPKNDTCGCNTAALAVSAKLSKHNIVHISNDNEVSMCTVHVRVPCICTVHVLCICTVHVLCICTVHVLCICTVYGLRHSMWVYIYMLPL